MNLVFWWFGWTNIRLQYFLTNIKKSIYLAKKHYLFCLDFSCFSAILSFVREFSCSSKRKLQDYECDRNTAGRGWVSWEWGQLRRLTQNTKSYFVLIVWFNRYGLTKLVYVWYKMTCLKMHASTFNPALKTEVLSKYQLIFDSLLCC